MQAQKIACKSDKKFVLLQQNSKLETKKLG